MKIEDLALQRSKYKHLSDDEWRWFLQQEEGRERTADKLPTFAAIDDWWYPVRLSCEQCSSELAARYKASLCSVSPKDGLCSVRRNRSLLDLTGGYGVDTYFLSEQFEQTDYVEQNAELCRIATHNFSLIDNRKSIIVNHTTAEDFLSSLSWEVGRGYDLIFLDPARRDSHGGKVFRLEDCTPNVVELLPTLLEHGKRLMIKLSPMLDLSQAIRELSLVHRTSVLRTLSWDIYVVAIKNEVKEVLLLSRESRTKSQEPIITAIDLAQKDQAFVFTKEEESNSEAVQQCNGLTAKRSFSPKDGQEKQSLFLYEPNAAILKAGAYKLIAERFGVQKLDVNTHLYCSDSLVPNFPGRVFKALPYREGLGVGSHANILTRNYPLTPEQLKKKLHLRDGGTAYVIGCRVNGKPTLFEAERVTFA